MWLPPGAAQAAHTGAAAAAQNPQTSMYLIEFYVDLLLYVIRYMFGNCLRYLVAVLTVDGHSKRKISVV